MKSTLPAAPDVWNAIRDAGNFKKLTTFPENWTAYRKTLRKKLWDLMGVKYDKSLALDLKVINTFIHENVTLRNITYQTRPGVYTTATLYLPEGKGPFPGVINMHGHWHQGRLAARVQSRGFTLAKKGYVVISVDTFGSGERSTNHLEFEYHGRNLGSHVFNTGETLMGCQLVDNMRAVDVLCSMSEVDSSRIGATGASGGGNQTMYLAAMDDRIKAAVPVCSVGSYESYLYEANCCCETLPGGLTVTEMAGILALAAPRAMLICTALYDSKTFSPHEMLRSYDAALVIWKKLKARDNFTYRILNHAHAYSPAAREAMLGFFELHLKGKGLGMPIEEEPFTTLQEEKLFAFEKGKRPEEIVSITTYLQKRGKALTDELYAKKSFDASEEKKKLFHVLKLEKLEVKSSIGLGTADGWQKIQLELSDNSFLPLVIRESEKGSITLFLHTDGKKEYARSHLETDGAIALLDLSFTGELAPEPPELVMPFHQTARRLLWLGKTLPGRWTGELCAVIRFLAKRYPGRQIDLHGCKEMAPIALYGSIFSGLISSAVLEDAPVSYVFCNQSDFFGLALITHGILKWGDIPLACALSPAQLKWINPRKQDGSITEVPEKEILFCKQNLK